MKDSNAFQVMVNVRHFGDFHPNEITVKVNENYVEITGTQDWRPYPGGSLRKAFDQRHSLPADINPDEVQAFLKSSGMLVIQAPVSTASLKSVITEKKDETGTKKKVTLAPGTKCDRTVTVKLLE